VDDPLKCEGVIRVSSGKAALPSDHFGSRAKPPGPPAPKRRRRLARWSRSGQRSRGSRKKPWSP